MYHISLFSGIGGFDLAAEWAGWENIVSCEINLFGNKVLNYYWPDAYHHTDIHTLTYNLINDELTKRKGQNWRTKDIILTGGFPCQPYSLAGKRLGKEDERHLWPEMLRIIREIQPKWIVGENVLGIVNWNGGLVFDEVQTDLEAEGYEVQPYVLPAASVNAPHRRDRVWFVAYSESKRRESQQTWSTIFQSQERQILHGGGSYAKGDRWVAYTKFINIHGKKSAIKYTDSIGQEWGMHKDESEATIRQQFSERNACSYATTAWQNFPTVSPICDGNDGLSDRLDDITFSKWRNESIKAAGNAIVPQVAYQIFKAINEYEKNL